MNTHSKIIRLFSTASYLALCTLIFTTSNAWSGFLNERAHFFENRLETKFRPLGSVTSLHYDFYNPDHLLDVEAMGDSAIWTGVYLGSQCLKYSQIAATPEGAETRKVVHSLLDVVEKLFWVTGRHGLLARFAFDPKSEAAKHLKIKDKAIPGQGRWHKGKGFGMEEWMWLGDTSRDQYTGIFFGLSTCFKNMPDIGDKLKVNRIVEYAVTRIYNEDWNIPKVANSWMPATGTSEFMRLMLLQTVANTSGKIHWRKRYESDFYNVLSRFRREASPTKFSNYVEYFAWNLRYLQLYSLIQNETKADIKNNYLRYFKKDIWPHTSTHKNTFFTFVKLGTVGGTDLVKDTEALNDAKESLTELMKKERRNFGVKNSDRTDLGRDLFAPILFNWINRLDFTGALHVIGLGEMSNRPLSIGERPNVEYYWQSSPQELDRGGYGDLHFPAVDVIVAYWLGRNLGIINEQE